MTVADWAPLAGALLVPLVGWLFARIAKARQAETHTAIKNAVDDATTKIETHVDTRFTSMAGDIQSLAAQINAESQRGSETRNKLERLEGRFDQVHGVGAADGR